MILTDVRRTWEWLESIGCGHFAKLFPKLDTMFQLLADVGSGPLELDDDSPNEILATVKLTENRRLQLSCTARPLAAIELQTDAFGGWETAALVTTDKPSHFVDLVSPSTIQQLLAVKPYSFAETEKTGRPKKQLVLHRIASIDPETFVIMPATETGGEAVAVVEVRTSSLLNTPSLLKVIAIGKEGWWNVCVHTIFYPLIKCSPTHIRMVYAPWGCPTEAPPYLVPANEEIDITRAEAETVLRGVIQ